MSMLHVPSMEGGSRTLPAELRTPRGEAFGWQRLHNNLTPVTEGGTAWLPQGQPFHPALSGIGDDTTQIPVDLPIEVRTFPNMQAAVAHDALNAVAQVQARYSPQAAAAVAAVLQRISGQASPNAVASLQRFLARSGTALSGVGYYDASGVWQPDESPYPVVMDSGGSITPTGTIDWGSIINSSSQSIAQILAISQGGSYSATGNVYGSPSTASVAAGSAQGNLNISGAGLSGTFTTPMLLLGIGVIALMVMGKR